MDISISLQGNLVALFATSTFIYFLFPRARAFGLIDAPSVRKVHEDEIPTVGGIAIFAGFLLALLSSPVSHVFYISFVLPAFLLVAVGALDDVFDISYRWRFLMQIVAGLIMIYAGGVLIEQLGALLVPGKVIVMGSLAIPFTLVCLVGLVNAFNMVDGIDGLAGSLTLVALLGFGAVAYLGGELSMVQGLSFLVFSLVAFLGFNARLPWRKRAHVFLGDCGSTLLGFAVVWFAVSLSQGESAVMNPVTPLWFVALPFFDMATVMIRRLLNKQSPFAADQQHLHHIFLAAGFSVSQTVLVLTVLALLLASIGITGQYLGAPEFLMFFLYIGVFGSYYSLVTQVWKRMRFLGRRMCRRAGQDRRSGLDRRGTDSADASGYIGFDHRGSEGRRAAGACRRAADRPEGTVRAGQPLIEPGAMRSTMK